MATDLQKALAYINKVKSQLEQFITDNSSNVDLTDYYTKSQVNALIPVIPPIPDELKDLSEDTTHRTVTDAEKTTWNNKLSSISKAQVEAVLTGEITSHTHAGSGLTQQQIEGLI